METIKVRNKEIEELEIKNDYVIKDLKTREKKLQEAVALAKDLKVQKDGNQKYLDKLLIEREDFQGKMQDFKN